VSSVPRARDEAASSAGWWLRSVVSTGQQGRAIVETEFAHVARGRQAVDARESDQFTEFDGHVPAAGPGLDPCGNGRSVSVTDLEGIAACPYRFFLKRGLGLRPVDERERDRDVWLDPLTRGSELHDVYAALLRRCRDAKRCPDKAKDAGWLRALAEGRLAELQREMPAATREIHDRESREFLADVELFLDAECEMSGGEPVGLEVSFGRPLDGDEAEPLAREEAVEIDLGDGLRFRIAGRIDRIDKVGPDEFQILDYKTGGYWADTWKGSFGRGRRLQHALYGLAAVELLKGQCKAPKVRSGVYYFPTRKGRRERVEIVAPPTAKIAEVVADIRAVIREGAFVHAPDEGDCRFCDYRAACDNSVHAQAERKLADPALAPFGRLRSHD
jgi:RecB family exonuclease